MLAQTAKLAFFFGLMALLGALALQNGWLINRGDAIRAATASHGEGAIAQVPRGYVAAPAVASSSHVGPGMVELTPDRNAQFMTDVEVNGARVHALVDTGASHVLLTAEDARALNIDPPASAFTAGAQTANGVAYYAPTRLRELRVGQIVVTDVEAAVAKPGQLSTTLLGMSFLRKLSSFQVADGRFVMRQ